MAHTRPFSLTLPLKANLEKYEKIYGVGVDSSGDGSIEAPSRRRKRTHPDGCPTGQQRNENSYRGRSTYSLGEFVTSAQRPSRVPNMCGYSQNMPGHTASTLLPAKNLGPQETLLDQSYNGLPICRVSLRSRYPRSKEGTAYKHLHP